MKKILLFISALYILLVFSGSVFAYEEKNISIGGDLTWDIARYRAGVTEISSLRSNPVLILSSGNHEPSYDTLDLHLSFDNGHAGFSRDDTGRYRVTVLPGFETAGAHYARAGSGAALFGGVLPHENPRNAGLVSPLVIEPHSRNAMFAPGSRIADFTIEFWLYPLNIEDGAKIFMWNASVLTSSNTIALQSIMCAVSKNRLQWSFVNFFSSVNGSFVNIDLAGDTHLIPKTWSHHLIRFDSVTGILEYLVDGRSEAIAYATETGREGMLSKSGVCLPFAGDGGIFMLGEQFKGLMDEFKIASSFAGNYTTDKYPAQGGRMETDIIDLGAAGSSVYMIEACGGRASLNGDKTGNEYIESGSRPGRFSFSDSSQMNFFIRSAENPWLLNESPWVSFTPGIAVTGNAAGRYVQIAADFYPSADGESSPYLERLNIIFTAREAPLPPSNLTASAQDGGVMLSWKHSPDDNAHGYLVYYSPVRGEYFGTDSALGSSPIDVGRRNSVFIDTLKNGTLYYFRIAAYDNGASGGAGAFYNIGEFSREVTARPLSGMASAAFAYGD